MYSTLYLINTRTLTFLNPVRATMEREKDFPHLALQANNKTEVRSTEVLDTAFQVYWSFHPISGAFLDEDEDIFGQIPHTSVSRTATLRRDGPGRDRSFLGTQPNFEIRC